MAAHQEITREWWESRRADLICTCLNSSFRRYALEMPNSPISVWNSLRTSPYWPSVTRILKLAEDLITEGPIPRKAAGDAAHIAIATVYGCEYLLTWNCRHIANAELRRAIRRVVEGYGYEVSSLCTPEELMGEEQ